MGLSLVSPVQAACFANCRLEPATAVLGTCAYLVPTTWHGLKSQTGVVLLMFVQGMTTDGKAPSQVNFLDCAVCFEYSFVI